MFSPLTVSEMVVFKKGKSIRGCRRRAIRSLHNFRDSRVEFYASRKQPVSKQLYTESYTLLLELLKIIRTGQQAILTMEALIGRKTRTVLCWNQMENGTTILVIHSSSTSAKQEQVGGTNFSVDCLLILSNTTFTMCVRATEVCWPDQPLTSLAAKPREIVGDTQWLILLPLEKGNIVRDSIVIVRPVRHHQSSVVPHSTVNRSKSLFKIKPFVVFDVP